MGSGKQCAKTTVNGPKISYDVLARDVRNGQSGKIGLNVIAQLVQLEFKAEHVLVWMDVKMKICVLTQKKTLRTVVAQVMK